MNGDKLLERYLNAACAGLFGLEHQTVRDELEANLLERTREFQVMGYSSDAALKKALEEFGAPGKVNRGMREVYIMPKIMKGGALAGLLAMGVYLAVGSSVAGPVSVTYDGPCKENCVWQGFSFFSVNSLERELRAQGVKVTRDDKFLFATFSGGARSSLEIQPNGAGDSGNAVFRRKNDLYVSAGRLLNFAYSSKLPLYLSSLNTPTLSIGKVQLTLEGAGQSVEISYQVSGLVAEWMCNTGNASYGRNPGNAFIKVCPTVGRTRTSSDVSLKGTMQAPQMSDAVPRLTVSTPNKPQSYNLALSKPNAMYAVLLPWKSPNFQTERLEDNYFLDVVQADSSGTLSIQDRRLTFGTGELQPQNLPFSFATSTEEFAGGTSRKALLLELTGRLDFGGQNYRVVSAIPTLEKLK